MTNWPTNTSTGLLAWRSAQVLAGPVVDTCWIEIFEVVVDWWIDTKRAAVDLVGILLPASKRVYLVWRQSSSRCPPRQQNWNSNWALRGPEGLISCVCHTVFVCDSCKHEMMRAYAFPTWLPGLSICTCCILLYTFVFVNDKRGFTCWSPTPPNGLVQPWQSVSTGSLWGKEKPLEGSKLWPFQILWFPSKMWSLLCSISSLLSAARLCSFPVNTKCMFIEFFTWLKRMMQFR